MKLGDQVADREAQTVIERGRQIRRTPDVVRARLLAHARASVAASAWVAHAARPETVKLWHGRRIAVAAATLLLFTAAGATAALYSHARRSDEIGPNLRRSPKTPSVRAAVRERPPEETEPAPQLLSSPKLLRSRRPLSPQESYAAELSLLQRAQSDCASQDFADALVVVGEHARRFPDGRLAEEREALRVRSLAGTGRGDEARRALAAFARRFPHSVLLPRLRGQARAAER